jgi:Ca2+-binding RTX toxin-like protein
MITNGAATASADGIGALGSVQPNRPPMIEGFQDDRVSYTEGGTAVLIDSLSDAAVSDPDGTGFEGGSLTVSITNALAEDRLIITSGAGITSTTSPDNASGTVEYDGIQFATWTLATSGLSMVFTFDASATSAAVQALIRALGYQNGNDANPDFTPREVSLTLIDGAGRADGGDDDTIVTSTIGIVGVNDAPAGADKAITISEDGTYIFAAADFGFTDVDGNDLSGVVITTVPANGTLYIDTDGAGIGSLGTVVTAGEIVSRADIDAGRLIYVPAPNGNGVGYGTFTFQVIDDGAGGGIDQNTDQSVNSISLNVTAVNDAPVLTAPTAATVTFTEGGTATPLMQGVALSDADLPSDYSGGHITLAVSGTGGGINLRSGSAFRINSNNDGTFSLALQDGTTQLAIGTITGIGTSSVSIINFASPATTARLNNLLDDFTFSAPGEVLTRESRTVTLTFDDGGNIGGGGLSASRTQTLTVLPANDAPTVANLQGDTVTFTEGSAAVRIDFGSDALVQDADEGGFAVTRVGTGLPGVLYIAAVPDGSGRLFVVQKHGTIQILDPSNGAVAPTPFLDVSAQVPLPGEQGLLGFVTAPDFSTSGVFYVYLTNHASDIEVRRYRTMSDNPDRADPASGDLILTIPHPGSNVHHGGWMQFGPDGMLYITTGDGSPHNDIYGNSQNPNSLLGKILRIDVSSDAFPDDLSRDYAIPADNPFIAGGGLPEVFALGFRNPYRASFDPETGYLYVGDVGQDGREEVDLIRPTDGGANYGWPFREGTLGSDASSSVLPVLEYGHVNSPTSGRSITGGYVYRGPIESLQGQYIFGDFITGRIWSVPVESLVQGSTLQGNAFNLLSAAFTPSVGTIRLISTFGLDEAGNLYIGDYSDGEVYQARRADDFVGGSLTVAITGNKVAGEDQLQIDVGAGSNIGLSNGMNVGSQVRVGGALIGVIGTNGTGIGADNLIVQFTNGATPALVSELLQALTYLNSNQYDPAVATRTITYTLIDGQRASAGGQYTLTLTTTVNVRAVADIPVAIDDSIITNEASIVTIAVLGNDRLDGAARSIAEINGAAVAVGQMVTLASGAKLTINAGGTLTYDPNGKFNTLTAPGSGAVNTSALDSFTYKVAGSNNATVTVTVNGLSSSDDVYRGDAGDNFILGTNRPDVINGGLGNDRLVGLAGDDDIDGGAGADALFGDDGNDRIRGGASTDYILGGSGNDMVYGEGEADFLAGEGGDDYLDGGAGNDALYGGEGTDLVVAGDGDDYAMAGAGNDAVHGGNGNDTLLGESGDDYIDGGADDDQIHGEAGNDTLEGRSGNDRIHGQDGSDRLAGHEGDDYLDGGNDGDVLFGDAGNDTILAGAGNDYVDGGPGNDDLHGHDGDDFITAVDGDDYVNGGDGNDALYGGSGLDTLIGGGGSDYIMGGVGNDRLHGEDEEDTVLGEDGDDYIDGGNGNDVLHGEAGNDTILGGLGNDRLHGQDGSDRLAGQDGDDYLEGGSGDDALFGDFGEDRLIGGRGNDYVHGGGGNDALFGNEDDDFLVGGDGDDYLDGGSGHDALHSGIGNDFLLGGSGNDYLVGDAGNDVIGGGDGDDRIEGGLDADRLYGDAGDDFITAGADNDLLHGGDGNDVLGGEGGHDRLEGAAGMDQLFGDAGDDTLEGGAGADRLHGGGGSDTFAFAAALGIENVDVVLDFQTGVDRIALDQLVFEGLSLGSLNANSFRIGTAAVDGDDRLIYNPDTGALLFDRDGVGGEDAVQFATFQPGTSLQASDFFVI